MIASSAARSSKGLQLGNPGSFEDRLKGVLDEHLTRLLDEAEDAAQERRVFARRRGFEGYYTIEAALKLATAVWAVEADRRNADTRP